MADRKACSICDRPSSMRCARCHVDRYCGRACQEAAWPVHRALCGRRRAPPKSAGETPALCLLTFYALPSVAGVTVSACEAPPGGPDTDGRLQDAARRYHLALCDGGLLPARHCRVSHLVAFCRPGPGLRTTKTVSILGPGGAGRLRLPLAERTRGANAEVFGALLRAGAARVFTFGPDTGELRAETPAPVPGHLAAYFGPSGAGPPFGAGGLRKN